MRSTEQRIPTETFLLPGQQFCIGLPWERAALPKVGVPSPPAPKPKAQGNALDVAAARLQADPFTGAEIGKCQVLRRLSPDSARSLLALRDDGDGTTSLVVMRRIELPDVLGKDVHVNSEWASRFLHPNLARVFPCELSDEGIFWVHELASGATLLEISQACRKLGKGMPHGLSLASVYEAALALGELHGPGFPHGLVSDQAVAVGFDGTARLLDTGLFRCVANKSSWGDVLEPMGPYFALEQLTQGRMPDPKCDVFSLGVVLYEALSGEKRRGNFDERVKQLQAGFAPPSRFSVTLDKALDEVVLKALSPDRAQRYANAGDFARALKKAAGDFMWKREQRSKFVRELFPARAFHEDELLADCARRTAERAPKRTKSVPVFRAPSLTSLPQQPPPPPPGEARSEAPPPLPKVTTIDRPRGRTAAPTAKADPALPWRRGSLLALLLAAVTGQSLSTGQLQESTWLASPDLADALGFRAPLPPYIPPPPAVEAPAPPAPEVDAAPPACDATVASCGVALPTPDVAPEGPSPEKKVLVAMAPRAKPVVRRKASSNEVPLPPWLSEKPARGKRGR